MKSSSKKKDNLVETAQVHGGMVSDNLVVVKGLLEKNSVLVSVDCTNNEKSPSQKDISRELSERFRHGSHCNEIFSFGEFIEDKPFKIKVRASKRISFPTTYRNVEVELENGEKKNIPLKIINLNYIKEWLGGYRDNKSGKEFHNAVTDTTYSTKNPLKFRFIETKGIQAYGPIKNRCTQDMVNRATQMARSGFFADPRGDKYIEPKPYVEKTVAPLKKLMDEKATIIQRWYRRKIIQKKVRDTFVQMIEALKDEKLKKKLQKDLLISDRMRVLIKTAFPKSRNNFFILFSIVENMWRSFKESLKDLNYPAEKVAELCYHLENHMKSLYALETQKLKSKVEALNRMELKLLEDASQSIVRKYPKCITIVDSLPIQRAREIKEIFVLYKNRDMTNKERIELLLNIRNVVETFEDFENAIQFIETLEEEIDLMNVGVPSNLLDGVRKKGEEIFLWYIKQATLNPSGKNYRPKSFPKINQRSLRCVACHKLKGPSEYPVHVRLTSYWQCKNCEWLANTPHVTMNLAPYAFILRMLRQEEAKKCPDNIYCNLLQPFGASFLVNVVWNGHSAISESTYVYELRLLRWNQREEWSPWNCIVLTQEEAGIHESIKNNEEVYEMEFIQSVRLKNINCKQRFKYIYWTQEFVKKSGLYNATGEENSYTHPFRCKQTIEFNDPLFKPPPMKAFVAPTKEKTCEEGIKIKRSAS